MALIGTLSSGVGALKAFTKDLEVIGNNISNVNTTAFKASRASFADEFSNTLQPSTPTSNAMQIGSGVRLASVNVRFSQGALASTGQTTDLGISGNGFFRVKNPIDSTEYVTRNGEFRWEKAADNETYLTNGTGMRVQGFTFSGVAGAGATLASTATVLADIKQATLPSTATKTLQSIAIGKDGKINQSYSDGTTETIGQVLLFDYAEPSKLMAVGGGLFARMDNAKELGTTTVLTDNVPNSGSRGSVESGTLELSNVDLTEQFANMITAQRSFQANSRLVTLSDNVLEEIVNLKR